MGLVTVALIWVGWRGMHIYSFAFQASDGFVLSLVTSPHHACVNAGPSWMELVMLSSKPGQTLRLGGAKTDTVYYKAMQNQMHRIDSQHLKFLASTTLLTTIEKIRRIQYLTGTLHSRKRAYWYGYCNTDICPNCKSSKDGGSHIMSACPAISTSYLSRHHALGRIIGKSVSQGNLGNSPRKLHASPTNTPKTLQVPETHNLGTGRHVCRKP